MRRRTPKAPSLGLVMERDSAVPMYLQLARSIEAQIRSGHLASGESLESEHKLCARHKISRVTVRLAIDDLVRKGLVERRQGKGTYVANAHIRHDPAGVNRFFDTLFAQHNDSDTRLVTFGPARPPRHVAEMFSVEADVDLVQLDRLYLLKGRPVGVALSWMMPEALRISRSQAEVQSSANLFEQVLGLRFGKVEVRIRAGLAGRNVARHLKISGRSPVLTLARTRFLTDGRLAEITQFVMNASSYEFAFAGQDPVANASALKILAA
jgi:GntR family transcriptional regulator